jgi:hypothetical protein
LGDKLLLAPRDPFWAFEGDRACSMRHQGNGWGDGDAGRIMPMVRTSPEELLADAWIAPAIGATYPDYRATLIAATGLRPGPGTEHSEHTLQRAEHSAMELLADCAL